MKIEETKSMLPYREIQTHKAGATRVCRRCQETDLKCVCHADLENLFDHQGILREPK